jgi:hypothetical protein
VPIYSIGGYCWLLVFFVGYWWLLLVIGLMAIINYWFGGYC